MATKRLKGAQRVVYEHLAWARLRFPGRFVAEPVLRKQLAKINRQGSGVRVAIARLKKKGHIIQNQAGHGWRLPGIPPEKDVASVAAVRSCPQFEEDPNRCLLLVEVLDDILDEACGGQPLVVNLAEWRTDLFDRELADELRTRFCASLTWAGIEHASRPEVVDVNARSASRFARLAGPLVRQAAPSRNGWWSPCPKSYGYLVEPVA